MKDSETYDFNSKPEVVKKLEDLIGSVDWNNMTNKERNAIFKMAQNMETKGQLDEAKRRLKD